MQVGMASLTVTRDEYDFPFGKCSFQCGSSTNFANKWNIGKGKTCRKCVKEGHFAVCKSKYQKLPLNLLQNESSFDKEYCFTINIPLAKTTFMLSNALLTLSVLLRNCSTDTWKVCC